jgi:hypothetical protein
MSKLEQAIQAQRQTAGRLAEIARVRKSLPSQITAAIEAGDSQKLADLKQRQTVVEADFVTLSIVDKRAAVEVMEAELTEASAKASDLTNRLPAEVQRIKEARAGLQAQLDANARELEKVTWDEVKARQICDDLKVKIAQARDALTTYVRLTKEKAIAA